MRGRAVGLEKCRVQMAVAVREVGDLWEMGTMCTWEVLVRWVSFGVVVLLMGGLEELE